jgi:hypothetical protein
MTYLCIFTPFYMYFAFSGNFILDDIEGPVEYDSKFLHLTRILFLIVIDLITIGVVCLLCIFV